MWGDIFSCQPFAIDPAMRFAGETLGLLEVRVRELFRASPTFDSERAAVK